MDGPRNGSDLPNAPGQKRRRVSAHWASPLARKPRRLGGRLFVRQPEPGACNARAGLSPGSRRALVVVPALNSCLRIAARPDGDDVVDGDRCCKHRPRRSRVRVGMYNRLGGIHGGKKNTPDDSGAITFSGTFPALWSAPAPAQAQVREYRRGSGPFRGCRLVSNRADALSFRSFLQ
jgi:hypothetical protein